MAKNDSTKAFTTNIKHKKKSHKSKQRVRQQVVISIFAVIALILVVFATLIIGKIITHKKVESPVQTPESVYTVSCNADDLKKGNLLLINDSYTYSFSNDFSNMENISEYRNKSENQEFTHINGKTTYSLTFIRISLRNDVLDIFNKMIWDYCNSSGFVSKNDTVVSNLEVAWGGYSESTKDEYQSDISRKDFYDHALGTTITLKNATDHTRLTEEMFKNNYSWLYNNAHKYGFILRFPNSCKNHTGLDSSETIHLRYIGIEHATYIHENGCCLDKYLETLRENYTYNNPLVINSADGKTYNVYYVAYTGNPTNVPVPEDKTYYISGDNMNGFIVTVEQ